jgi:hypothetical protein
MIKVSINDLENVWNAYIKILDNDIKIALKKNNGKRGREMWFNERVCRWNLGNIKENNYGYMDIGVDGSVGSWFWELRKNL